MRVHYIMPQLFHLFIHIRRVGILVVLKSVLKSLYILFQFFFCFVHYRQNILFSLSGCKPRCSIGLRRGVNTPVCNTLLVSTDISWTASHSSGHSNFQKATSKSWVPYMV